MDISINDIGLSIDGNSSNDYINSENLLAFEITNNDLKFASDRDPNLAFKLKPFHLYVPPADGVVLEFIFETGGV